MSRQKANKMTSRDFLPLRKPLPQGRSYDQIRHHFAVEERLASRLLLAPRSERTKILLTMYDELFSEVPDHPRITKRNSTLATEKAIHGKFPLIDQWIEQDSIVLEFAPGDCRFAFDLAKRSKMVYGIDISDQIGDGVEKPKNFELIIYDGYETRLPAESIDLAFSDQLIEHFHPDDVQLHFHLIHRLLKKNGLYVFRTPHPFTGPHDVSQYFSDTPKGFHLKEWTFTELKTVLSQCGFRSIHGVSVRKNVNCRLPFAFFRIVEMAGVKMNKRWQQLLGRLFVPGVNIIAFK